MVDVATTPEDKNADEFLLLVLRYFDGDLNAAELNELNERLAQQAPLRRLLRPQ